MRNITIAYTLSFLWKCWFWLGIWVFYYLRFTDYAGIGFLEAVMITTATIGEIPTGAIADILGKKIGSKELWGNQKNEEFYQKMWKKIKVDKK